MKTFLKTSIVLFTSMSLFQGLAFSQTITPPAVPGGVYTVNGALKSNGSGVVTQANCASLSDAGSGCTGGAAPSAANPAATVGPTAVNGTATTYIRSDGAPAINLTANYAWTGTHTFSQGIQVGTAAACSNLPQNFSLFCATTGNNVLELQQNTLSAFSAIGGQIQDGSEVWALGIGLSGTEGMFNNKVYLESQGRDIVTIPTDGNGNDTVIDGTTGNFAVYANGSRTTRGTKVFEITRATGNIFTGGILNLNYDNAVFTPGTDVGDANRDILAKPTTAGRPSTLSVKDGSNTAWDFTNGGTANSGSLYISNYDGGSYTTPFKLTTAGALTLTGSATFNNGGATGTTGKALNANYVSTGTYSSGDPGDANRGFRLSSSASGKEVVFTMANSATVDEVEHIYQPGSSSPGYMYLGFRQDSTYTTPFKFGSDGTFATHGGKVLIDTVGGQTGTQGSLLTGWYNTGGAYTSGDPGDSKRGLNIRQNTTGYAAVFSLVNSADNQNEYEEIYQDGSSSPGCTFYGFRQDGSYYNPLKLCSDGTELFKGTIPTVTGTGSPTITTGSTDTAGEVTGGTLATSIVITFSSAKTNAPFCTVTSQSSVASFGYSVSTTAITVTLTATTAEKINYICFQR